MICPRCGEPSPDSAAECKNCFYKFRFGHGYGDPNHAEYGNLTRGLNNLDTDGSNPSKDLIIKIGAGILAVVFILPFFLALLSYLAK